METLRSGAKRLLLQKETLRALGVGKPAMIEGGTGPGLYHWMKLQIQRNITQMSACGTCASQGACPTEGLETGCMPNK